MKFEIDTRHDQPRFIRATIALLLSALDDGSALPNVVPSNLIAALEEKLPDARIVFGAAPPPPPPAAAAFVAPPPPAALPPVAPPPVAGVELDREGYPWDARIHANSKAKIANGTWKLKKGMSEQQALVDGVRAELRRTMAIPAAPVPPLAPPPAVLPHGAPPPPAPLPPVAPPPPPAALPPVAPPAAPVPAGDPQDFASFMAWIAGLIQQGRWTHDHTTATLQQIGLPGAVALASRPDLIPQVVRSIKTQLGVA